MTMVPLSDDAACWPTLPLAEWQDTCATLHMWTQIVGKVRLKLTPLVNHWWNVPLYVTAHGLTTSRIPYGPRAFELRFDFLAHRLVLETSDGTVSAVGLKPMTVADFYRECLALLASEGIDVKIWRMPVEVPNPIPFDEDTVHAAYDAEAVERFWRVLLSVDAVFHEFRSEFIGKVSPVHFFWGSFDLAVTRFSGRQAYSHEVSSVGFWPGTMGGPDAAFYSYAAPSPEGFSAARVRPEAARWDAGLGEFLLAYDEVRRNASPVRTLLEFCRSTYQAAARFGQWDRGALERPSM